MRPITLIKLFSVLLLLLFSSCLKKGEPEPIVIPMPEEYEAQGTIIVKSKNITICARDWDAIDGDIINIVFNGKTIATNVEMTGTNKCWELKNLPSGDNWIGITAISQGKYGSASPRIEVNDGISTQGFNIKSYINTPGAYTIRVQL